MYTWKQDTKSADRMHLPADWGIGPIITGVSCALDSLLNLQESDCACVFYCSWLPRLLPDSFFCFFFFSGYKFDNFSGFHLAVLGSLVAGFSCHFASYCDAVSGSCITYFSGCSVSSLDAIKGSLAAVCFSCHFKCSCVVIAGSRTANFAWWWSLLWSDSQGVCWDHFCFHHSF